MLLIASIALMGFFASGDTQARSYKAKGSKHHSLRWKRFTKRQLATLPIHVTRPPNTGHYIYQNYPVWAARAFQPIQSR